MNKQWCIDGDKLSQAVLFSVAYVHVRSSFLASKTNKCTFRYFLFRPGCYTNHRDDASRHRAFINTDNYTFLQSQCSPVVNIFAGNQVVIPVAVPHSAGLPEMNPSMSLCRCVSAERKHDRLHFDTALNKSLARFSLNVLLERCRLRT